MEDTHSEVIRIYQKPGVPKETRTEIFVRVANGTKALDAVEREKYGLSRRGFSGPSGPGADAAEGGL